jgi:hypothetical protein
MASTFRTIRFFDRVAEDGSSMRVSQGFSPKGPALCFSVQTPDQVLGAVFLNRVQAAELRIRIDGFLGDSLSDQAVPLLWEDEEEVR